MNDLLNFQRTETIDTRMARSSVTETGEIFGALTSTVRKVTLTAFEKVGKISSKQNSAIKAKHSGTARLLHKFLERIT